jgi:hypothetical protein
MTDQELTLQAVRKAQGIIEEYVQPTPHDHERLLDRCFTSSTPTTQSPQLIDCSVIPVRSRNKSTNSGWLSRGDRPPAVFSLFKATVPAVMN